MSTPTSRFRAALTIHLLNDALRESVLAGIEGVAPTSPLLQNPALAASFTALKAKGAVFAGSIALVAANDALYRASVGAANDARLSLDLELRTFKTLAENNALTPSDLPSVGLSLLQAATPSRTPPDPPASLLVRMGAARGKARVTVDARGYQGRFAAESSSDGTTWSPLPGTGKQRKLSGYPAGERVWVRFAAVRFGLQSAWCTPVLVIFS